MSNLLEHAKRELSAIGAEEAYDGMIQGAVIELIECFSTQGHSGFSAGLTSDLFGRLARYEPLAPLTGEDSEWNEVAEGVFQNNRCSHVFKQADRFDGQAYDIQGKVFREPDGSCFTGSDSFVPVTFPYTPSSITVDVEEQ